ncbi:MAG: hypothetical protein ACOYBQ_10195 [Fluviibacter sp.]|jgi:hypothetical protein
MKTYDVKIDQAPAIPENFGRFHVDENGTCVYDDINELPFAFACGVHGLDLMSFDKWMHDFPQGEAHQELREWRWRAFEAFIGQDFECFFGWANAMHANWKARISIDTLEPNARLGLKHRENQRKRAKKARLIDDRFSMKRQAAQLAKTYPKETAKELFNHLFAALEELGFSPREPDEAPLRYEYSDGANARTIKFKTFEGYVSQSRKGQYGY